MKRLLYTILLALANITLAQVAVTPSQGGGGGGAGIVVTPTIMSEITPLSSAQMRADALQEAHYLQITFEGETIDWEHTTQIWEDLPRPQSGKRSIDDIRNTIIGHEIQIHVFDPKEQLRFRVGLWGKNGLLLEGVSYFQLDQVGPGEYAIPDYLRYLQLDLPEMVSPFVGDAISGKITVKDENGNYQTHYFSVWEGMLRDVPRGLLDQSGLLILTKQVPPPSGQEGGAYISVAYDIATGENVEAVHSSTEVHDIKLAGWLRLPATELDVFIQAYDGIAQIPNVEVAPVPMTGWYRLSVEALNQYWQFNGLQTSIEKPEWVTLRNLDSHDDDIQILPDQNGVFWMRLQKEKRYHVITGHWPTIRERQVPVPTPGKG